ncbi:hypothetical protein L1987_57178 [Smallanthus sonchifolius]|uniref:Uncharacterized protein n=1 Tax=Smallanthus sonchifolius TaxID=185202 RepID=A0ACB9DCA8_9ASTR|nr:hypothetical protein L1987_57178 [Smallanthus sonchifolius]
MSAKRIASRLACKSISSSILTLYEIELFQFMRESEKRYAIKKAASALRHVVDFIRELNCMKVSRSGSP